MERLDGVGWSKRLKIYNRFHKRQAHRVVRFAQHGTVDEETFPWNCLMVGTAMLGKLPLHNHQKTF
jgi:hypothetical protein